MIFIVLLKLLEICLRPRLCDREWVGHCTVDVLEELQRLVTSGVLQFSPDAGVAAVGNICVTVDQVRLL